MQGPEIHVPPHPFQPLHNKAHVIPRTISSSIPLPLIKLPPLFPHPLPLLKHRHRPIPPVPLASPNNLLRFIPINTIHQTLLILLLLSIPAPLPLSSRAVSILPRDLLPYNNDLFHKSVIAISRAPSVSMFLFLSVLAHRRIDKTIVFGTVCPGARFVGFSSSALAG